MLGEGKGLSQMGYLSLRIVLSSCQTTLQGGTHQNPVSDQQWLAGPYLHQNCLDVCVLGPLNFDLTSELKHGLEGFPEYPILLPNVATLNKSPFSGFHF